MPASTPQPRNADQPRRIPPAVYKVLAGLLAAYGVVLAIIFTGVIRNGVAIETNIQAMTPQVRDNPAVAAANEVLDRRFSNLVVIALASEDRRTLNQAADSAHRLLEAAETAEVRPREALFERYENLVDTYRPYRFNLLSAPDRQRLAAGDPAPLVDRATRRLVDLPGNPAVLPFSEDPFGLFGVFFRSLPFFEYDTGDAEDGYLVGELDGRQQYIKPVILEARGGTLDLTEQQAFVADMSRIESTLKDRFPDLGFYRSGLVFHAEYAASRAKREFSLISTVSILSIVALFVFCFRSVGPLLLGMTSLGFSFAAAFLVGQAVFSEVHILTLVFGAGLIGVAIDYSLHYFSHARFGEHAAGAMDRVFPSLAMGMATTVAGYSCLYQTSMPALFEVATFCITGLISAWLFVVVVYPRLGRGGPAGTAPAVLQTGARAPALAWQRVGRRRGGIALAVVGALSAVIVLTAGRADNNVRLLYEPPPRILEQDRMVTSLLPERSANQFFVVSGGDAQQVLRREEQLAARLEDLTQSGALKGYSALSRYVPSVERQQQHYTLREAVLYADGGALQQTVERLGLSDSTYRALRRSFEQSRSRVLRPEAFLADAPEQLRSLWLGQSQGSVSTMVSLRGIRDLDAVAAAADASGGIVFVDRVRALSTLLQTQHARATGLLIAAYCVIGVIVLIRYRRARALPIVLIPAASALISLAVLTLVSIPLSLFHVLALYLALGLGLDYGIFLYDTNASLQAKIAVLLSAATSMLSFGLLSLSSTPMIANFGITVLLAVIVSLLISPLAAGAERTATA